MHICEPTSVPEALRDTDKKSGIFNVKGSTHARLIYPAVRAVLMRWDVVGDIPSNSTLRSTASQCGTGDVTLAPILAGANAYEHLDNARRLDDDHLQGITVPCNPPPPAALYCPGAAR